jgi:hypothetical protein
MRGRQTQDTRYKTLTNETGRQTQDTRYKTLTNETDTRHKTLTNETGRLDLVDDLLQAGEVFERLGKRRLVRVDSTAGSVLSHTTLNMIIEPHIID